MSKMFFLPFRPAFDSAGITVPGAQFYFTLAGTNTPSAPYTASDLATHLENPIVANGIGYLPPVYLDPAISYRVRVYDADAEAGVDTPLEEYDPYVPALANIDVIAELAPQGGAVADVTMTAGQLVNLYVTSGVTHMQLADGSDQTKPAHAYCVDAVTSGQVGTWARRGVIPDTEATTFASALWLSDTTPGAYTSTAPSTTGHLSQYVGMVLPGFGVDFNPQLENYL